jgi:hypothetical protein
MLHRNRRIAAAVLVAASLQLAACGPAAVGSVAKATNPQAAKVEKIDGGKVSRVILTDKAAQRLGIKTVPFQESVVVPKRPAGPAGKPEIGGGPRKVIPYAAVVYDVNGGTWAYTSTAPLTFVRQPVKVDYIDGDLAVLVDGPPPGSSVVTVGAAELFGAELGLR